MNERMPLFGDKLQYMTMEVSGLPPGERRHFRKAEVRARRVPKLLRRQDARGNIRFYDPPIPIRVEGSLFFDISRAHGQSPEPPTLHPRMPVICEVHPISGIEFEPGPTARLGSTRGHLTELAAIQQQYTKTAS